MQGESDGQYEVLANLYQENESKLIGYIRDDLKDFTLDHLNFVDACVKNDDPAFRYCYIVNQAKLTNASNIDNCYCIKTNGEDNDSLNLLSKREADEMDDNIHYSSISMLELGREAAKYLVL